MKSRMCLIWHEAGNTLYHDRFDALCQNFDLVVVGPREFMGKKYLENDTNKKWQLKLFDTVLHFHWLTFFSIRLLRYIKKNDFDIIYIHEEPHSIIAFLITFLCGRKKIKVLETSVINTKGNLNRKNILEKYVYKKISLIFPKNTEVKTLLVKRGASTSKITSPIGNGVSESTFKILQKEEARKGIYASSTDRFILGYAGRIWGPKGIEILINIKKEFEIDIVLCGPNFDDELLKKLQSAGIVYLGELRKEQLNVFYSSLDAFILPSLNTPFWREQFGRVCAEAIYSGTPAFGSKVGGIPMVVGESNTFLPNDYKSLKSQLERFLDKEKRLAIHSEQYHHIKENFSWEAIADQVYNNISGFKK